MTFVMELAGGEQDEARVIPYDGTEFALSTERLVLRPFVEADVGALQR